MSQTKSNYTPLLNALDDMKHSPVYAVRRGILQGAMDAIISLEVRLREIEQVPAVAVPDEEVAKMFHESYEKLAPSFGYETREETRKDWKGVPPNNKALMIAVIKQIRLALLTPSHSQQSAEGTPA